MSFNQNNLNNLSDWGARLRTFLGAEAYDQDCATYIDEALVNQTEASAAGLSVAITRLNRGDYYDDQTGQWSNQEARGLWAEGHAIRDAILGVTL